VLNVAEVIEDQYVEPVKSGVRAMAVDPDGGLVDDFRIIRAGPHGPRA